MDTVETNNATAVSPEALALLAEIGEEISSSLDLDEVLAKTAALVKRAIDYEIFAILLVDEAKRELYFRFAIGHRKDVVEKLRIPLGQGITGAAIASGKSIRVRDVREDPRYINAHDLVRSELAVPLVWKGKAIGVLDIQSRELDAFTRDEQKILTLLAGRLAIAIENAHLFERTRRQAETLLLLNDAGRQASELLELDEVLRRSAQLVKRIIDYQIFSILLYDETEHVFRHSISVKFGQHTRERTVIRMGEGIVGAAAASRQPVVVADVSRDLRYIAVNPETRSELAVPLIVKNRVIGVLDLESPQLGYFNEEHAQALFILGAHLAVSIENARLYQRVARDEARMERDLQAARQIQGALLPPVPSEDYGLEIAARYVSAVELGGDLYDFLRYGPQQLGVALGDVSGKGTAAALYGAMAIGILRSLAPQKLRPAHMLQAMKQVIEEQHIEGRFMTLCFATWHRRQRRLRIASAGQSQPLLVKGGRAEKLALEGIPLGIAAGDGTYHEMALTLERGDLVVLYSDGVVEGTNGAGAQFGFERLRKFVSANALSPTDQLADGILEEVEHFAGKVPARDDRTLVILKVK